MTTERPSARARNYVPGGVWLLGAVSLLTDIGTEAIYPLLPLFLVGTLGAGPIALGAIEGLAEATSSLLKLVSGWMSDRSGARRPLVRAGYGLSSAVRPLIALAAAPWHVLVLRFLDRVGKGVRTAPRDAMLAAMATPDTRGRVFGFHRAMDHVGAILGPLAAVAFLQVAPEQYRALFALTAIPSLVVIALLIRLPPDPPLVAAAGQVPPRVSLGEWRTLPPSLRRVLVIVLLFTVGNASDAFLLLRMSDLGATASGVALAWAALHAVKTVSTPIGGLLSDRVGRRTMLVAGWGIYALVYAGFALATTLDALIALLLVYGLYYGCVEGPEKALVADLVSVDRQGTGFGTYHAAVGLAALGSSVLFGVLWSTGGPALAFTTGAALALIAALLLARWRPPAERSAAPAPRAPAHR
jgi:MFS family permease